MSIFLSFFVLLQDTISVHRPGFYAQRFQSFIGDTVFRKLPPRKSVIVTSLIVAFVTNCLCVVMQCRPKKRCTEDGLLETHLLL